MPTVPGIHQDLERCAEHLGRDISVQLKAEVTKWKKVLEDALVTLDKPGLSKTLQAQKSKVESCLEHDKKSAEHSRRIARDIQELRAHKLLFDYADFLPVGLERLRTERGFQASGWSHKRTTWQSWLKAYQSAEREGFKRSWQKDLRTDLRNAATELRLPFDQLMAQIETYAGRDDADYPDVSRFVEKQQWTRLAEKLWEDRHQIPTIVSLAGMGRAEEDQYLDVVDRVRSTFFVYISDDGETYVLNDHAVTLHLHALGQGSDDGHRAEDGGGQGEENGWENQLERLRVLIITRVARL